MKELSESILLKKWQIGTLQCSGGEQMCMQREGKKVDIFLNVITVGMIDFVPNSKVRKYIVKIVRTQAGLNLLLKK